MEPRKHSRRSPIRPRRNAVEHAPQHEAAARRDQDARLLIVGRSSLWKLLERRTLDLDALAVAGVATSDRLIDKAAVSGKILEVARAAQQELGARIYSGVGRHGDRRPDQRPRACRSERLCGLPSVCARNDPPLRSAILSGRRFSSGSAQNADIFWPLDHRRSRHANSPRHRIPTWAQHVSTTWRSHPELPGNGDADLALSLLDRSAA